MRRRSCCLAIQDRSRLSRCRIGFLAACYAHMGRLDDARDDRRAAARRSPRSVPTGSAVPQPRAPRAATCRACAWRPARRHEPDPPSRRDPRRRCGGLFAADRGRRGRHARTPQGAARASSSIRRSPSTRAASSRPPATACWSSSPASSMRCAARSRCSAAMAERNAGVAAGQPHRVPHRHQSRRHRRRGRRHLWRRRQRRRPPRSAWPSRRDLRLGTGAGGCRAAGSTSPSRTWASSRSRTSRGRCGSTACRRPPASAPAPRAPVLPLPDKPSIAVLPFANMSGDPEQEYFADGMVEEIITALSPHPLAVRHRPQFDLHLQGPSRRREAGRARTRRALCARRLGAQGRQPGAHHRRS